jgi:hypothetical protein
LNKGSIQAINGISPTENKKLIKKLENGLHNRHCLGCRRNRNIIDSALHAYDLMLREVRKWNHFVAQIARDQIFATTSKKIVINIAWLAFVCE